MDRTLLGANIKYLRNKKGLGQEELANYLGVAKSQVSKYEKGTSLPRADSLYRIADLFEVTTDDLGNVDMSRDGVTKKTNTSNDELIIELLFKEVVNQRQRIKEMGGNEAAADEAIEDAINKLRKGGKGK